MSRPVGYFKASLVIYLSMFNFIFIHIKNGKHRLEVILAKFSFAEGIREVVALHCEFANPNSFFKILSGFVILQVPVLYYYVKIVARGNENQSVNNSGFARNTWVIA